VLGWAVQTLYSLSAGTSRIRRRMILPGRNRHFRGAYFLRHQDSKQYLPDYTAQHPSSHLRSLPYLKKPDNDLYPESYEFRPHPYLMYSKATYSTIYAQVFKIASSFQIFRLNSAGISHLSRVFTCCAHIILLGFIIWWKEQITMLPIMWF
jgi:hypothetical protein